MHYNILQYVYHDVNFVIDGMRFTHIVAGLLYSELTTQ